MSSKKKQEKGHPGHSESKGQVYNENARSGPADTTQSTSPAETIRVIFPGEPPRLNPRAAAALLRILLKAHAQLDDDDNPEGGAK